MERDEVFRLSAKALAKHDALLPLWDPFNNAYQRWECVEWILVHGRVLLFDPGGRHESRGMFAGDSMKIECQAAEFPARAVAEVQRRRTES